MNRVEAVLADLGDLTAELLRLDEELRRLPGPLLAAIDAAWASSRTMLGPRPDIAEDLLAARRRAGELGALISESHQALARAGGVGSLWWAVSSTHPNAPATTLTAGAAIGAALAGRTRQWLALVFHGRSLSPGPMTYVIATRSETYNVRFKADASVTFLREELSDGRVRITELTDLGIDEGVGLGAACSLAVDGHAVLDDGLSLSAGVALNSTTGLTWLFDDVEAADRWWHDHRRELRTGMMTRAISGGGPLWDIARRLSARWFGNSLGPLKPNTTFEQLSASASAAAEITSSLGSAAALVTSGVTVRHTNDATLIVTFQLGASATATAGDSPTPFPSGESWIGADLTAALSVANGAVTTVTLRSTTWDEPGRQFDRHEALDMPGAASATDRELHAYHTTVVLDLSEPAVRRAIGNRLGIDLAEPASQLRAVLQTMALDERLLDLASVSVLEQTPPAGQLWRADCSIHLPALSFSGGFAQGIATAHTVRAWEKPPGSPGLVRVR